MNKICHELHLAKHYMLKPIKNTELVALTLDNVAKVEAMIKNDAAYLNSGNINFSEKGGSTAYCMCALRNYINSDSKDTNRYREIIFNAVCAVDRDNSTHLNADGVGRDEITNRICSIQLKDLINYLKRPHETEYALVKIIADKTSATKRARENKSFASKFCHYACFYLFEGQNEQDNYSIYDSILKNALPYYAEYYKIKITKKDLEDYAKYSEIIEKILEMSGNNISKNGFDHLLWYYFKGRNIKNINTE